MRGRHGHAGQPEKGAAALSDEPDSIGAGRAFGGAPEAARGFIVVAVLWILAALSALVLIYLSYVTSTAVLVAGTGDRAPTEALEAAGVELTVYQLAGFKEEVRPTSGTFTNGVGTGKVTVSFRSEAARIDLNAASKDLIAGLMIGLGAAPENAAGYADHIIAWRMPTKSADDDPENAFYRAAGIAYLPRHAPYPDPEELWLVQGIPPLMVERVLPFVTVFSNLASVNLLAAAPQVLAALPGMTPERLQQLLAARSDPALNPRSLLGIVGGQQGALESSRAYRMEIAVETGGGRRDAAEVVILLTEDGDEPYRVLSWRNGSDGSTAAQKDAPG